MNFFKKIFFGLFLFFFFQGGIVFAEENIPKNSGWVTDNAQIFSDAEESQLVQKITEIEKTTTAEIAILTVPNLGDKDIFSYGIDVAQHWGIGKKERDNGLLLLIAVQERKYRFFSGYGIEGALPDIRLKKIGDTNFPKYFPTGNYFYGVKQSLDDIERFLQNDPEIISKYSSAKNSHSDNFSFLFFLIVIGSGITAGMKGRKKKIFQGVGSGIVGGVALFLGMGFVLAGIGVFVFFILSLFEGITNSGYSGGWSSGGGFSSSGGFGGFGGGGFGGGGAGGDW